MFTLAVFLLFLLAANGAAEDYGKVSTFRGASLQNEVFYPMIAQSVNLDGQIRVNVNKKEYQLGNHNFRVNDKLEPMVSLSALRDLFHVSVSCDPDGKILLQRSSIRANLTLGKRQWTKANGAEAKLTYPPVASGDNVYLPLQDICDMLGGELSWNNKTYTADLDLSTLPPLVLPEHFDLREEQRAAKVRNQGDATTCWAYAASGAMESTFLPANPVQISPDKILGTRGYGFTDSEGGDYMMALSYFLSGKATDQEGHPLSLYEARFHQKEDQREIKESVYRWGGVSTSIYTTGDVTDGGGYNGFTKAYCYRGSEEPNHDVVVIGWDDDFPASNFSGYVPGPGAFICQNSWGEDFGEGGVFYVSYYDSNIGDQCVSYTRTEKGRSYGIIHQQDEYGWTGQVGYKKESIMAAQVFEAETEELVKAVGFYATGKDTKYEVYLVQDYRGKNSLKNRVKVAEGTLSDEGYYTVAVSGQWRIPAGKRSAAILYLKTPGASRPMAVEYTTKRMTESAITNDGEGFISKNGLSWDNVEEKVKGDLCLKVYADPVKEGGK
ncbi:Cysteine protease, C1A family [Lachnospiraceae bacterium KHCPX20]|nr:Cysteine protease, C1A family [Lachnospiraceae bacterium KHCPX20]